MTSATPSTSSVSTSDETPVSITVFRAGTHRAMDGRLVTISQADLDQAVAVFAAAPDRAAAPLVLGHPKDNAPAWGWVSGLRRTGDQLIADFCQVRAEVRELVKAGHYKHVSASFFPPAASGNPSPGQWALRHVGLLGAVPPAVRGLPALAFAGDADDAVCFAGVLDGGPPWWTLSRLANGMARFLRGQREKIIADRGLEAADRELSAWEVGDAEETATRFRLAAEEAERAARPAPAISSFADPMADLVPDPEPESAPDPVVGAEPVDQDPPTHQEASFMDPNASDAESAASGTDEIAALKAQLAERDARLAQFAEAELAAKVAARQTAATSAVDAAITAGRLPPGEKAAAVAFMAALDSEAVSFGDDGTTLSPADWFAGFLTRLPKAVEFGQVVDPEATKVVDVADFSQAQFAEAITAKMNEAKASGRVISFADALSEVTAGSAAKA